MADAVKELNAEIVRREDHTKERFVQHVEKEAENWGNTLKAVENAVELARNDHETVGKHVTKPFPRWG